MRTRAAPARNREPNRLAESRLGNEYIVKGYAIDKDTLIEVTKEELSRTVPPNYPHHRNRRVRGTRRDRSALSHQPVLSAARRKVGPRRLRGDPEIIREMDKVAIGRAVLN